MSRSTSRTTLAAVLAAALCWSPAVAAEPGDLVPFFKASDVGGRPVALGDLVAGRRVAVFFWDWRRATSVRAMQALGRLQQTYAKQGFVVVAVEGEGSAPEQVVDRVEKLRAIGVPQLPVVVADPGGRIARQFRVGTTPEIFLLDGAGRVMFHLEGFRSEDDAVLEQRVTEALGLSEPAAPKAVQASRPPEAGEVAVEAPAEPPAQPPADPRAALLEKYRYFGNYSLNRGDAAKAEEYFRKYVELAPEDADVWLRIGEACVRQRRYDQAREAWEQVLRIQPGHPEADANIRRLIRGEY